MPLSPLFDVKYFQENSSKIIFTDISTGSDVAIASRRVYLKKGGVGYLVPQGVTTDYNVWPLSVTELMLDILKKDSAVNIIVEWMDVNNNVLYRKSGVYCFTSKTLSFYYYLCQNRIAYPPTIMGERYFSNASDLYMNIKAAEYAVMLGRSAREAQQCLDRATEKVLNENKYF